VQYAVSQAVVIITLKGMYGCQIIGECANSKLEAMELESDSKTKLGLPLDSFLSDNAVEQLYYLEMNYAMNTVNYQHKTILIIQESDTWDEF
jgi:hypothetical protein